MLWKYTQGSKNLWYEHFYFMNFHFPIFHRRTVLSVVVSFHPTFGWLSMLSPMMLGRTGERERERERERGREREREREREIDVYFENSSCNRIQIIFLGNFNLVECKMYWKSNYDHHWWSNFQKNEGPHGYDKSSL